MRTWFILEVALIVGLVGANGAVYWGTHDYPEKAALARQTPPPAGQVYLNTCDGRPTDYLGPEDTASCLADYPGEFARAVTLGTTAVLFALVNILWMGVRHRRSTRHSDPLQAHVPSMDPPG